MPLPSRHRAAPVTARAGAAFRRPAGARPLVLGHRGARQRAPENTLAAFALALDEGADGIELDVRLDGSGDVVVLHDRTLTRVSAGRDPRDVETLGSAALGAVDVGDGQRVPRLAEVLEWAARRGALVNVELKQDVSDRALLVARVAALLRAAPGALPPVLCSSFHPGIVRGIARRLPAVPAALLVEAPPPAVARSAFWRALGARGLNPAARAITPALAAAVRARGDLVFVWTVNDGERARALARLGVDGLITDDPRGLLAALG